MAEVKINLAETEKQVKKSLNKVRPFLQNDGGDVEFISIVDNIVYVRMLGACVGCSSIDGTLRDGIEAMILEEVPGIIGVENVG